MEIVIDVTSPVFPYVQIANKLRDAITAGEIPDVFPSLWDIAHDAGVSYNTARRAAKVLKDEGLIHAVPGRGTFVVRATS